MGNTGTGRAVVLSPSVPALKDMIITDDFTDFQAAKCLMGLQEETSQEMGF